MSNEEENDYPLAPQYFFDLTTPEGLARARKVAQKPSLFGRLSGQLLEFVRDIVEKGTELIRDPIAAEKIIKEQREAAVEIIKAGKEANVSSIQVVMDQAAGFDFSSIGKNTDVKATIGKSGKMTINVVYK
jgi:hypothetical protein